MIAAARPLAVTAAALRRLPVWPVSIWLVLVVSGLITRPPLSPIESEPFSLAWWMWQEGALLPSTVEGLEAQPPLLFWLIHLGWAIFGVSEVWARLVTPLTALAALMLIGPAARLIWPERPEAAPLAGVVLVGSGGFTLFSGLTVFNMPLLLFVLLGLYGVALARRGKAVGWALFGVGLGLGFLMNGPVALMHLLPLPLLTRLWMDANRQPRWAGWYVGLGFAILLGALISLTWIAPSLAVGGMPHLMAALFDPIALGLADFGPWYWFLLALPLALYPWLWWRTLWRAAQRQLRRHPEEGLRFCGTAAAISGGVALIAGDRQFQDLLPALPALALIAARLLAAQGGKPKDFHAVIPGLFALFVGLVFFLLNIVPVAHLDSVWREFIDDDNLPIWLGGISQVSGLVLLGGGYLLAQMTPREIFSRTVQVALLPVLLVTTLNIEFLFSLRRFFDLEPVAQQIHSLQQQGAPVAVFGGYRGEFDFSGRLEQPLTVIDEPSAVLDWAKANENGIIVSYFQGSVLRLPGQPLKLGIVGNSWTALWSASTIQETDGTVLQPRF
ncbi:glycosyltransferase family 39 protein [Rhodospirillaceae bacterium SYSU D60014]|uniref:ArnT family glycosyltransferase n=1 Tax=Virgifigura deserti TaxID=2268457 RepID=UPI000E6674C3